MILYCDGTHYVSTCYESIVMRVHFMIVHFMTVHITLKHLKVKCKASAIITFRGLCFFTFLAQTSCHPSTAASISLLSAQAGSLHGMPHFPIPPNQGGKSLTGFPTRG